MSEHYSFPHHQPLAPTEQNCFLSSSKEQKVWNIELEKVLQAHILLPGLPWQDLSWARAHAFVMSLVLPTTLRGRDDTSIWDLGLKMISSCSRSHTCWVTDLNHWDPHHRAPFSCARDAEFLGEVCGPCNASVSNSPGDSPGLPGLGTTVLHQPSYKSGIFNSILHHRFFWGLREAMDRLYKKINMVIHKNCIRFRLLWKFWSFYVDLPRVMNSC